MGNFYTLRNVRSYLPSHLKSRLQSYESMRLSSRLSTPAGPLFKARRPKPLRCKTTFSSIALPSGTPRASPTVRVGRLPATLRRALVRLAPKRAEAAAAKKGSPPKTRRSAVLGGAVAAAGTPKGVRRDAAATAAEEDD